MMVENERMGNRIRKLRISKGMNLTAFAKKIGKTPSYLSQEKYEVITIPGDTVFAGTINLLALGDEKVLSFKENKLGNEKLRALGLEVFDPPLSQFLMGGSGPHCLSCELIRDKH